MANLPRITKVQRFHLPGLKDLKQGAVTTGAVGPLVASVIAPIVSVHDHRHHVVARMKCLCRIKDQTD